MAALVTSADALDIVVTVACTDRRKVEDAILASEARSTRPMAICKTLSMRPISSE
jgi:hypothetical protein